MKHFLSVTDLDEVEINYILKLAQKLKHEVKLGKSHKRFLLRKTLVMIFEKPSLRTRLSFEIGMTQLGGHAIYIAPSDIGMGRREPVADIAKVTSSMGNVIMARTFAHETIVNLAKHSTVPVINGLSDLEHPCQILADILTILEVKKKLIGIRVAYLGDSENNVTHSLALVCGQLGMHLTTASPKGYWLKPSISAKARQLARISGGSITETKDPKHAVRGADIVYTDTWVSMGDEKEKSKRIKQFKPYQVTSSFMKLAKPDAIFMHELPAYKGNEVTAEVIDGPQSVVWQQAENRLHAQKALLLYLLGV